MTEQTIKVFACDHRKIVRWDLPFIRVGTGYNNNSAIKDIIEDNIMSQTNDKLYSECTALYWIWKHLSDFGGADFIGFCHYRRFLSLMQPNYGVFPIALINEQNKDFIKNNILSPEQQLKILISNNADGLLPTKFPDYGYIKGCNTIWELMKKESDEPYINLGMSYDLCEKAFQFLLECTPEEHKKAMENTFLDLNTYHFNIFTLKYDLFDQYCTIFFNACKKIVDYAMSIGFKPSNERWLAYLTERYSSCIFKMFQLNGKKTIDLPIVQLEKIKYE